MIRRLVDILISGVVLLLLNPLFLLIALAIRLDSPGKAIYRGWRVGKDGQRFQMLKFRSMVANADSQGPSVSGKDDKRVTKIGRFLRASKLDEFPQFWNVFKGEMTLIGPRPESPDIVEQYSARQKQILSVKPGLTGPSQLSCSEDESMAILSTESADDYYIRHVLDRRLAIDAEYIRNRSVLGDLSLVARTLALIFRVLLRKTA